MYTIQKINNPEISVVMSVYNGQRYLKTSVECILKQTFQNFEFIIINDGSTDGSIDILNEYSNKDQRIIVINQDNIGLTKSLNKGIRLAKGRFIARQDVDDISLPERLEKQINVISNDGNIDLVASWYLIIDDGDNVVLERKLPRVEIISRMMKYENLICHSSAMFRKAKFHELGGYDENRRYGQDKYLWIKMKKITIIPESLVMYRWHMHNVTHKRYEKSHDLVDMASFRQDRVLCCLSSLLLQQGEQTKARRLLKGHLKKMRHFFYFLLTFLPFCMINLYMSYIRFHIRRFLGFEMKMKD